MSGSQVYILTPMPLNIPPRYSAWGPRLYTFFMYLNDVDQGGETRFTKLNLLVMATYHSSLSTEY